MFLPVTLTIYWLVPADLRKRFFLVFSFVFLAVTDIVSAAGMLVLTGISCAFAVFRKRFCKNKVLLLLAAAGIIILYITAFVFYAAYNFSRFSEAGLFMRFCPVGMAFFVLQGIRFTADVLSGKVLPDTEDAAHFLLFYPRLAMGPVQSYEEHSEMCRNASMNSQNIGEGLSCFIRGLSQKVLLADVIGVVFSSFYGGNDREQSILMTWTALLAFALQFYFTVSGYSRMAEGIALCYGFRLPESYDTPVMSGSISGFGNRWNKTVVNWFKGCFAPLLKSESWYSVLGTVFAWTLMGFWYRPALPVVVWGIWMGLWIGLHYYFKKKLNKIPSFIETSVFAAVSFLGCAIFSADSFSNGLAHIGLLIGSSGKLFQEQDMYFIRSGAVILVISMYCASGHFKRITEKIKRVPVLSGISEAAGIILHTVLLILCAAALVSQHAVLV